jgi:hypothetical protein
MISPKVIANMLEQDRVATSQVKEHISPARLMEMLEIDIKHMSASQVIEALKEREDLPYIANRLVKHLFPDGT